MIEIQGLKKSYGTKLVLDGVHLTVPDGAKFGLGGINGDFYNTADMKDMPAGR